jgi:hypothetical protein
MAHESFTAALHETVYRSTRPAKQLADVIGVSYSALAKFADESDESQIPTRRLVSLITVADNLAVLDYLEQLAGRVAFRRSEMPHGDQFLTAVEAFLAAVATGEGVAGAHEDLSSVMDDVLEHQARAARGLKAVAR